MKIAIIQPDIIWENKDLNFEKYETIFQKIFTENSGVDLIVLPEFFSFGFSMNVSLAETEEGESLSFLKQNANKYRCAIIGSIPVMENEKIYNRAYFVTEEFIRYYDKKHLFSYGGEDSFFTAGTSQTIVDYLDLKIKIQICYDLRFPVWSRIVENNYDVLINISCWPSSRISVTEPLTKARAIENQSYAIFVNRTGNEPSNSYNGNSIAVDFKGNTIFKLGPEESYGVLTIDKDKLTHFREKFPVWKDADKFYFE